MKITNFSLNLEISKDENGYSNNYYVDVNDEGVNVSHPYVTQTPEQVMFITNLVHDFIASAIAFNTRVDGFNRDNHLEQYAPKVSESIVSPRHPDDDIFGEPEVPTEEEKAVEATKLSAEQELESTDVSEVPQTCALGDEEVSVGTECEIKDAPFEEVEAKTNNPVDAILATESSEEDGKAVAYFAEELSKVIDAREKKN